MFAQQLFLKISGAELARAAGGSLGFSRISVRAARLLAPWFLMASVVMLFLALGFWGVLFLPFFMVGYFLFSLRSMRDGGPILPTAIAVSGIILVGQPEAPVWVSRFLATFGMALWCNRFSWWFADWSMSRNPALSRLFQQKQGSAAPSSTQGESQILDAEVIEITDA